MKDIDPISEALFQLSDFCYNNKSTIISRPLPKGFQRGDKGKNLHAKGKSSDMPHDFLFGKIIFQSALSKVRNISNKRQESDKQNQKTIASSEGLKESINNKLNNVDNDHVFALKGFRKDSLGELANHFTSPSYDHLGNIKLTLSQFNSLPDQVKKMMQASMEEAVFTAAGIGSEDLNKLQYKSPVIPGKKVVCFLDEDGRAFGEPNPVLYECIEKENQVFYYELDEQGVRLEVQAAVPEGYSVDEVQELVSPRVSINFEDSLSLQLNAEGSQKADIDLLLIANSGAVYDSSARMKTAAERIEERIQEIVKNSSSKGIVDDNEIKREAEAQAKNELDHLNGIGGTTDIDLANTAHMRAGGVNSKLVTHGVEINNYDYNQDIDSHWPVITSSGDFFQITGFTDLVEFINISNNTSECLLDMNLKEIDEYREKLQGSSLLPKLAMLELKIKSIKARIAHIDVSNNPGVSSLVSKLGSEKPFQNFSNDDIAVLKSCIKSNLELTGKFNTSKDIRAMNLSSIELKTVEGLLDKSVAAKMVTSENITARELLQVEKLLDPDFGTKGPDAFIRSYEDYQQSAAFKVKLNASEVKELISAGFSGDRVLEATNINHVNPHWGLRVSGGKFEHDFDLMNKRIHILNIVRGMSFELNSEDQLQTLVADINSIQEEIKTYDAKDRYQFNGLNKILRIAKSDSSFEDKSRIISKIMISSESEACLKNVSSASLESLKKANPGEVAELKNILKQVGLDAIGRGEVDQQTNKDIALYGKSRDEVEKIAGSSDINESLKNKLDTAIANESWEDIIFSRQEIVSMGLDANRSEFRPEILDVLQDKAPNTKFSNTGKVSKLIDKFQPAQKVQDKGRRVSLKNNVSKLKKMFENSQGRVRSRSIPDQLSNANSDNKPCKGPSNR